MVIQIQNKLELSPFSDDASKKCRDDGSEVGIGSFDSVCGLDTLFILCHRLTIMEFSSGTAVRGLVALVAITGTAIMYWHTQMSIRRKGEAPVRWSWIPFLGWAIEMGMRPIELLQESADKFGEIFGLVVAGSRMFIINDCHSATILFRATKDLSWEEFHHSILHNFFGTTMPTLTNHLLDEDLMRKWYHIYIYR